MKMLVAGATGSIGFQVLNTASEMGYQPVVLVKNKSKVKSLARIIGVFKRAESVFKTRKIKPANIHLLKIWGLLDFRSCQTY